MARIFIALIIAALLGGCVVTPAHYHHRDGWGDRHHWGDRHYRDAPHQHGGRHHNRDWR